MARIRLHQVSRVLALTLTGMTFASFEAHARPVRAQSKDSVSAALASAQAQGTRLEVQVTATAERIDRVEAALAEASTQLTRIEARVAARRVRIAALAREERATRARLNRLLRRLAVSRRQLSDRAVASYMAGQMGTVESIAGAGSINEMFLRADAIKFVTTSNSDLVNSIESASGKVRVQESRLVVTRREQAHQLDAVQRDEDASRVARDELAAQRDRLASSYAQRNTELSTTRAREAMLKENLAALDAADSRVRATITSSTRPRSPVSVNPLSSGPGPIPPPNDTPAETGTDAPSAPPASSSGLVWPARGPIVSPFGPRWGKMHNGIDIAAPAGTPLHAAQSGTVIYAGSMSGYGNMVIIQHANDLSTGYAHQSRIAVTNGQAVVQGDVIGYVGCTGHCYGDHVHFETRIGGSAIDPMNYL